MISSRYVVLAVSALVATIAGPVGCGSGSSSSGHSKTPGFDTTVVIGDSLSAGFQNGSLLDTQQPNGWASLVAKQAGYNLTLPLIAAPGAPAVLQLVSIGPPPVVTQVSGTSPGRDNPNAQPYDLAVPGHLLSDLINRTPALIPTSPEDLLTDAVLAEPLSVPRTQLQAAIHLNPTALYVWIGNNDALVADIAGTPSVMTPVATFTTEFTQLMTTLHTKTKAKLIVANIPDVTAVPYLTPGAVILAEVSAGTGLPQAVVSALFGIQPTDLVNTTGLAEVESNIAALKQGKAPTPLDDTAFLDAAEAAQVQSTVDQYNAVIAQQVSAVGGTLVDIHTYLQTLEQGGITINNYPATTTFLGGLFGLDGIHPTNTGYALIANQFIAAVNASFKTSIATVDVGAIASADPYFGPNIKPVGAATVSIPLAAARRADLLISPRKAGL
ncbi:MAG TPA: SGNH/GDSL hydrolase family protein [Terracidiphilus sp.]|jgi:lysophospholipase L1-like esterase